MRVATRTSDVEALVSASDGQKVTGSDSKPRPVAGEAMSGVLGLTQDLLGECADLFIARSLHSLISVLGSSRPPMRF